MATPKDLEKLVRERMNREAAFERAAPAADPVAWLDARERAEREAAPRSAFEAGGLRPEPRERSALERMIGRDDLVSIDFFRLMERVAKAVCLLEGDEGAGTGALIAPGLLITNNHVTPTPAVARSVRATFGMDRRTDTGTGFELDPDAFFVTSDKTDLDYTVVAVRDHDAALAGFGVVPLAPALARTILLGEPVSIVQHPERKPKMFAVRANDVTDVTAKFLRYTTDTNPGSSGSPVFEWGWRMVALHHMGVARTIDAGEWLLRDGRTYVEGLHADDDVDWIANEGVRIDAILRDLRAKTPADKRARIADLPPDSDVPEAHGRAAKASPEARTPGDNRRDAKVPAPAPAAPAPAVALTSTTASGATVTLRYDLPLDVSVRVGAPLLAAAAPPAASASGDARRDEATALVD